MSKLIIEGGSKLKGEIDVQGAKNSALPVLAATLLGNDISVIHNCPKLSDVDAAVRILEHLGCRIQREQDTLVVDARNVDGFTIPESLMREMRSSIVFLGAIISRMKKAVLSTPGGCELGPRPIDLHLDALKKLGVLIEDEHGFLRCQVKDKIRGTKISLSFPSVGATENILLACVLGEGTTTIYNAAQEPEIVDLANYLNRRGANINGAGKSVITVTGVSSLHQAEHWVIPDRIVATTYLCGSVITGGEVCVHKVNTGDLQGVLTVLEQTGAQIRQGNDFVLLKMEGRPCAVKTIRTMPYPGFPTDAQAPVMAALSIAQGTSIFVENIFESRYKHSVELNRMGADIKLEGKVAVCTGVPKLTGATVHAEDLRGGAALVLAGLNAQGITIVKNIYHIDRGYEKIEADFGNLGAHISRVDE